jgi:hypothetical protein
VGTDALPDGVRVGGVAFAGVTKQAKGEYRFELTVECKDQLGGVVFTQRSGETKLTAEGEYKLGAYAFHKSPPSGTYYVQVTLSVIVPDGKTRVLDTRHSSYTVK